MLIVKKMSMTILLLFNWYLERKGDRERKIYVRVKHQSAASCMPPTGIKPTNQACIALNNIDRYLWGLHFSGRKKINKI